MSYVVEPAIAGVRCAIAWVKEVIGGVAPSVSEVASAIAPCASDFAPVIVEIAQKLVSAAPANKSLVLAISELEDLACAFDELTNICMQPKCNSTNICAVKLESPV